MNFYRSPSAVTVTFSALITTTKSPASRWGVKSACSCRAECPQLERPAGQGSRHRIDHVPFALLQVDFGKYVLISFPFGEGETSKQAPKVNSFLGNGRVEAAPSAVSAASFWPPFAWGVGTSISFE